MMRVSDGRELVSDETTIHTSLLFDSVSKVFLTDISLTVSTKSGLITSRRTRQSSDVQLAPGDVDLRGFTVLPGLVDSHTHIFLHAYTEATSVNQERDESLPERILRASNHLRKALKAGYTTYRDLGTEGLRDLDTGIRDAVNRGIIPGPRLFVATDPLASPAGYEVRIEGRSQGTQVQRLSDPCSGVDGVKAAVRRRLGAGADLIKFYAEYRRRILRFPKPAYPGGLPIRFPPVDDMFAANPNSPLFDFDEMKAIVSEARRAKCPVASHAIEPETVMEAVKAGVTTLEHGFFSTDDTRAAMKEHKTIWVPTLAVVAAEEEELVAQLLPGVKKAWETGVKLACGGDTGAYPHGENIQELELFERAEIPLEEILTAATLHGWEACGGDWCGRKFGWLGEGWAGDLVAVREDPREKGISCLRDVECVFKDGSMVVKDGKIIELV